MKQLEKWQVWWRAAIASVSIALGVVFDRRIEGIPLGIKFIIAVPVIALLVHAAETLLEASFNRSQWLRTMAFGGRFIEGNWAEVVFEESEDQTEKIVFCALITIGFDSGDLCVSGKVFDAVTKEPLGNFSSTMISYDAGTLTYIYDSVLKNKPAKHHEGYGIMRFDAPRKRAQFSDSFSGYFIDPVVPRPLSIYGQKITDAEELTLNNNDDYRDHVIKLGTDYNNLHFRKRSQKDIAQDDLSSAIATVNSPSFTTEKTVETDSI